jgi:signal transduction histidine kinase
VLADDALQSQVLPLAMRKDALLICKEALHNIVKHAGATSVVVKLYLDKEKLAIDIADNGTWQLKPQATGTGLHSMQERAYRLGGTLQIVQQAGGTTVSLHLPIP